jgi:uncharacterized protein
VSASCIYAGTIRHRRRAPRKQFRHRLVLVYIDLDELPQLLCGRLVRRRPGALRFRRDDYLGDPRVPLADEVRDRVEAATGVRPRGPVRLLTQLRSFGLCFNPVSFYYCLDGEKVQAVVAEVTNTPWGERHAYVITGTEAEMTKALHVSPFLGMEARYRVRLTAPGRTLSVHIDTDRADFDATLKLERRSLTRASAGRLVLGSARTLALIYGHALGLALARAPYFRHPEPVAR